MSVLDFGHKNQPLRRTPINHRAYHPWSKLTIEPINHRAYRAIDHWAFQPSSLLTMEPIDHRANLWSSFATFMPFGLFNIFIKKQEISIFVLNVLKYALIVMLQYLCSNVIYATIIVQIIRWTIISATKRIVAATRPTALIIKAKRKICRY